MLLRQSHGRTATGKVSDGNRFRFAFFTSMNHTCMYDELRGPCFKTGGLTAFLIIVLPNSRGKSHRNRIPNNKPRAPKKSVSASKNGSSGGPLFTIEKVSYSANPFLVENLFFYHEKQALLVDLQRMRSKPLCNANPGFSRLFNH